MRETPNKVERLEITDLMVYLHIQDRRVIGNPLGWHPWLLQATDQQRKDVELYEMSVYFPSLDDGLDAEEMMKGIPLAANEVGKNRQA